jgi:dGTPase
MFNRWQLEEREFRYLSSYASFSRCSRGRIYEEKADKYRTVFQRDRDRIIHSKAFRRLKHKTQVFVSHEGDHFRTRLTHTLEVSQIARHISRMLGCNEDLVESISLAHDLGHTPFGHAGEEVLNFLLKEEGGFEHNNQSKRIVEVLENKYPTFPGLNLTVELLEGLMKHNTPYDNPFNLSNEQLVHPSLEAQIVNLSDQLAYITHDLDDGLSSGILNNENLVAEVELWRQAQLVNEHLYPSLSFHKQRFLNVRYLINAMIINAINNSEKIINKKNILSIEDVYHCDQLIIDYDKDFKEKIFLLQKYLFDNFYSNYKVIQMAIQGKEMIQSLFEYYLKNITCLPEDIQKDISNGTVSPKRGVADSIAMMTDKYLLSKHTEIFG